MAFFPYVQRFPMRLFAVSDLHTDYEENRRWIAQLSRQDFIDDALIVAGDISDAEALVEECFEQLAARFRQVFYVPGNHELWVPPSRPGDSLEKFHRLLTLAHSYNICTQRMSLASIDVVPLFAWYDFSFGAPSRELLKSWMDFVHCRWPQNLATPRDIASHFLQRNEDRLQTSQSLQNKNTVVSFSHFLPRIDLMPHFIPPKHQMVYPVLGSWALDRQVRAAGSTIHIYGHSHVNRDINIDGVRYINNAFAYPSEDRIARKALHCVLENI